MNNNANPIAKPKSSWRWPLIIVGMLLAHVTIMMTALAVTLRNPGESAVINDYYDKAQAFDSYKASMRESQALGWKLNVEPLEQPDPLGFRQIRLTLTDSTNKPVANASLDLQCFHLSHADQMNKITASTDAAGQYTFPLKYKYVGFWQFDLRADLRDAHYIQSVTNYLN